jgi:dienelactone hydrolase
MSTSPRCDPLSGAASRAAWRASTGARREAIDATGDFPPSPHFRGEVVGFRRAILPTMSNATRAGAPKGEFLIHHDGAQELEGFVARPAGAGARPVVVVVHAWGGQDDFAREKAAMLAEHGYIGFAADVYGKGRRGTSAEENSALMTPWVQDRAALRARLLAAVSAARGLEGADPDRLAVIGFCFGGLCAFDLARANAPGLRAAVGFHALFTPPALGEQAPIAAKVLALHGYDDPMATPDAMVGFANEMTAAKADWQLVAYGGTSHAFTNPHANDPANGLVYRKVIADRAFAAMRDLLAEAFA